MSFPAEGRRDRVGTGRIYVADVALNTQVAEPDFPCAVLGVFAPRVTSKQYRTVFAPAAETAWAGRGKTVPMFWAAPV